MKNVRSQLKEFEVKNYSKAIFENLFMLDILNFDKYFIYINFGNEVDTESIIEELKKRKKKIYLPKISAKMMKSVKLLPKTTFLRNNYCILEPSGEAEDIDDFVAIMPCLSVDGQGNRIGFGGGYYDKFLQNKKAIKVVICYDFQVVDKIDSEPFDIPVDYVVTEKRIIKTHR